MVMRVRSNARKIQTRHHPQAFERPGPWARPTLERNVGGPDHVTIALVVHGPALRAFHSTQANPDLTQHVGKLSRAGVGFTACGNTVKSQKVTLADLLPGFVSADKGGVVRIAELQSQGYLYLRP